MPWSGSSAASYADSRAEPGSTGECAKFVRRAIEWGGITLSHTTDAKDYGPILEAAGFERALGSPRIGDVIVIQPVPSHPAGHMAIYDGHKWISDFRQLHGFYPGPTYREAQPSYRIYRHD
jgi:hypothetical protein